MADATEEKFTPVSVEKLMSVAEIRLTDRLKTEGLAGDDLKNAVTDTMAFFKDGLTKGLTGNAAKYSITEDDAQDIINKIYDEYKAHGEEWDKTIKMRGRVGTPASFIAFAARDIASAQNKKLADELEILAENTGNPQLLEQVEQALEAQGVALKEKGDIAGSNNTIELAEKNKTIMETMIKTLKGIKHEEKMDTVAGEIATKVKAAVAEEKRLADKKAANEKDSKANEAVTKDETEALAKQYTKIKEDYEAGLKEFKDGDKDDEKGRLEGFKNTLNRVLNEEYNTDSTFKENYKKVEATASKNLGALGNMVNVTTLETIAGIDPTTGEKGKGGKKGNSNITMGVLGAAAVIGGVINAASGESKQDPETGQTKSKWTFGKVISTALLVIGGAALVVGATKGAKVAPQGSWTEQISKGFTKAAWTR